MKKLKVKKDKTTIKKKSSVNPLIFRAYDIRGIAMGKNQDLTETTIKLMGKGIGTYLQKNYGKNMVVGRDNRLTSEKLQKAFIEGLLETGCRVTNIGLSTSPMIYWATCALKFDSGINITASHNPKEYNGIKIVAKNAHSVCGDEIQEILTIIEKNKFSKGKGQKITGKIEKEYIADLLLRAKLHKKLKIGIDAGNGVTGLFAEKLFKKFGCEVIPLYCELDGNFPNHEANPENAENLMELSKTVKEEKCDIGLGFDGDGDRLGVIDDQGIHHSADYILLLLAEDLLKRMPNSKIVFDVKVSQTLINGIRDKGGIPVMSKTGHSFIESKMRKIKAPLGGEISGHFFFAENYYGFDDAFLGALRLLDIISGSEKKLSEILAQSARLITTPEFKAHCPDNRKFNIIKEITEKFSKKFSCIIIDGVRVNFDTITWGAIRCSNTSPNLTLRFEAPTTQKLHAVQKLFVNELKKYPEVDLSWYREKNKENAENRSTK